MIIAAYFFLGVFLLLVGSLLFFGLLFLFAWWHDRHSARGFRAAKSVQSDRSVHF